MSRPNELHWEPSYTAAWLRLPGAADNKYRRGVLGARIGSATYPGAAVLGVTAAWRAGVGLLRYVPPFEKRQADFGLPSPAAAVLAARPETVFGDACGHPCDAWLIGSGTDPAKRPGTETAELRAILTGTAPVVVDAGALALAAEVVLERADLLAPAILTPHLGEFERLWQTAGLGQLPAGWFHKDRAAHATQLAERLGTTVLLKGSVTVIASPGAAPFSVGPATAWLAAAGTGDVLAGIVGALVACHADVVRQDPSQLRDIAAAAAQLHDTAARVASGTAGSTRSLGHPITALDVANAVPSAFALLRSTE